MELLTRLRSAGLSLSIDGDALRVRPREALTDEIREEIRQHKTELIEALTPGATQSDGHDEAEAGRLCVIEMLNNTPGIRYAYTNRFTPDAVIVTLAVRGVGTCELSIPKDRWDPFLFLSFLNEQRLH